MVDQEVGAQVGAILVDFTPSCEHAVATYLHLLSLRSGGAVIPLDVNCQPEATGTDSAAQ